MFQPKNLFSHLFTSTSMIENGICQHLGFLVLKYSPGKPSSLLHLVPSTAKNLFSHLFTLTRMIEDGVCQHLGFLVLQYSPGKPSSPLHLVPNTDLAIRKLMILTHLFH